MSTFTYFPEELTDRRYVLITPETTQQFLNQDERLRELRNRAADEYTLNLSEADVYSLRIVTAELWRELRRQRIAIFRDRFFAIAILWVVLGTASYFLGMSYQPFVAIFIATVGIAAVLAMKASGK